MDQKTPTNFYVYQLRRADRPEPFYIGKGKGKRSLTHLNSNRKDTNHHKQRTIAKSREEGVDVVVEHLAEGLDENTALRMEVWFIHLWGRSSKGEGPLTNLTDGGDGIAGHIDSEETRARKAEGQRGRKHDPVSIEKTRQAHIGSKRPAETCEKVRAKALGRVRSAESRMKQSNTMSGKPQTPRTEAAKRNASIAALNRDNTSYLNLPKGTCVHCGKTMNKNLIARFHGDKCKEKP